MTRGSTDRSGPGTSVVFLQLDRQLLYSPDPAGEVWRIAAVPDKQSGMVNG
jgi:hypothetical protein